MFLKHCFMMCFSFVSGKIRHRYMHIKWLSLNDNQKERKGTTKKRKGNIYEYVK